MASTLPKPGRARLAPMLGHDGRLKGDLTLFNWGDGTWWIMGSYYLRAWHMRWFNDHMRTASPCAIWARTWRLLAGRSEVAQGDREADRGCRVGALPFMGCGEFDIGLMRCKVGRLSVTGELGYEIHCRMGDHIALREALLEAGAIEGMREYGFNALLSLRLEKSFGIWSAEFTQGYTPGMTGMDRWIDWDKGDFIGREAALAERDGNGPAQKLVTLEVDADGRRRQRVRAGLEGRQPRGLRHLGRLRPHGGQVAGHGDGGHRSDAEPGTDAERAYRGWSGGAGHSALAL
jgi:dimethylglycine dehydrogenase